MSKSTKNSNVATPTAEVSATTEMAAPVTKETAVNERLHVVAAPEAEVKFRGKQRQITYDALKSSAEPLSIADVAKIAAEAGLTAKGGVEPSVRYHLHHLVKDAFVKITNPTFELK